MFIDKKLYQKIIQVMPIPCVDLVITNQERKVLLVKRNNEPARGLWWFPGGRVHHSESRNEAVDRKLYEECGLTSLNMREIGTYDLMFEVPNQPLSHAITTVFHVEVIHTGAVELDDQSREACWQTIQNWQNEELHSFIRQILQAIS